MPRVGFSAAETPTYGSASSNGGTTREALTRSIPPFYTVSQTDFQRVLGRNLQYMILRAEKTFKKRIYKSPQNKEKYMFKCFKF